MNFFFEKCKLPPNSTSQAHVHILELPGKHCVLTSAHSLSCWLRSGFVTRRKASFKSSGSAAEAVHYQRKDTQRALGSHIARPPKITQAAD